jgi:DNA-directed RNA polymerase sigma subunit (sigma70/sigma32)
MSSVPYTLTSMNPTESKISAATRDTTADLAQITDPAERAKAAGQLLEDDVPLLQSAIREVRQGAVAELRAKGLSFAEIGAEIGVTRARAKQILEGDSQNARARRASRADAAE